MLTTHLVVFSFFDGASPSGVAAPVVAGAILGKKKKRRVIELPNGMRIVVDADRKIKFNFPIDEPPTATPETEEVVPVEDPKPETPVEAIAEPETVPQMPKSANLLVDPAAMALVAPVSSDTLPTLRSQRLSDIRVAELNLAELSARRFAVENEIRRQEAITRRRRMAEEEEAFMTIIVALESDE